MSRMTFRFTEIVVSQVVVSQTFPWILPFGNTDNGPESRSYKLQLSSTRWYMNCRFWICQLMLHKSIETDTDRTHAIASC